MFGFLDNCVNYGADVLSTSTDYRRCVLEIFDLCMTSRALGAEDRVIACKLAEALLLRLRGQVDEVRSLPRSRSVHVEADPLDSSHRPCRSSSSAACRSCYRPAPTTTLS